MSCSFVGKPFVDVQHLIDLPLYSHNFSSPDVNNDTASIVSDIIGLSNRSSSSKLSKSSVVVVVVVVEVVVVSLGLKVPCSSSRALKAAAHSSSPTAASRTGKATASPLLERRKQDFGTYALVFQLKRPAGALPFKAQVLILCFFLVESHSDKSAATLK